MLQGIIDLWFVFVALSLIFTVYDIRNTPVSWVQKLGWILVVMYAGPFGLFFYMLACRSPGKDLHALYTQAHWKQSVNSEVHCVAGDATGIIIAAIFLSYFTIPSSIELIIEYTAGFICGWVIFQAGMMSNMYGSYTEALRKTFFAEATSMNCVMLGMIPTMVILGHHIPESRDPSNLHFWFVMGMATLVGGLTAYPMNSWLVANQLKHGCMTIPEKGEESMQHAAMGGDESGNGHAMKTLPMKKQLIIIGVTFLIMLIAAISALVYTGM